MTRINVGIKPRELQSKLLLAELREIKRIPNNVAKGKYNLKTQPPKFKLGSGHVAFFYDKCGYLLNRYIDLREEAIRRDFDVQDFTSAWNDVPKEMMGNYIETIEDRKLLIERITSKGFDLL